MKAEVTREQVADAEASRSTSLRRHKLTGKAVSLVTSRSNLRKFKVRKVDLQEASILEDIASPGAGTSQPTFNHYEIRITSCCRIVIKPNLETWPPMMWSFKVDIQAAVEEDATFAKENRERQKYLLDGFRNQRPTIAISKARKVKATLAATSALAGNLKIKKLICSHTLTNLTGVKAVEISHSGSR